MILEFNVTNFRSIREEQTLECWTEAVSDRFSDRIHPVGRSSYGCLPSVGIYGANASGKSNMLKALKVLSDMMLSSARIDVDEDIPYYQPYKLAAGPLKPVRFEIEYSLPGKDGEVDSRCRYELEFTAKTILHEKLVVVSDNEEEKLVFQRGKDDTKASQLQWGADYETTMSALDLTFLPQHTVLSASRKKPNVISVIRNTVGKLGHDLKFLGADYSIGAQRSAVADMAVSVAKVFLPIIDVGVVDAECKSKEQDPDVLKAVSQMFKTLNIPVDAFENNLNQQVSFYTTHVKDDGCKVNFSIEEESDGTQKIFSIMPSITTALCEGAVLVIDEIERSMHPFMAEMVVKLFNDPTVNVNGAQLIYTTHDTNLMSQDLLRKDQIWFAEKNRQGASRYFSLKDFDANQVNSTSPFVLWYVQGRFGGIPILDYSKISEVMRVLSRAIQKELHKEADNA